MQLPAASTPPKKIGQKDNGSKMGCGIGAACPFTAI